MRFFSRRIGLRLAVESPGTREMPKSIGQWTGIAVTTIIVLGCDMDVAYAMPLGVLAGALATFFMTLADARFETAKN